MSYRFQFQKKGSVLVIVFEGQISVDEERKALSDVAAHADFNPGAQILVDRRQARIKAEPKDVGPQVDLARRHFPPQSSRPKMALVAGTDYEFAMMRMLEMTASGKDAPHDIYVFREIDEACRWLELDKTEIEWPE